MATAVITKLLAERDMNIKRDITLHAGKPVLIETLAARRLKQGRGGITGIPRNGAVIVL
jgi:hypothetical protein